MYILTARMYVYSVGWTDCTGCGNTWDQEADTGLWWDATAVFPLSPAVVFPLSLLLYSHYPCNCIPIIPAVVFPLSLLLYSIIPAALLPLYLVLYSHDPCCCIPIIPASVFPLSLMLYSHYPCCCISVIPAVVFPLSLLLWQYKVTIWYIIVLLLLQYQSLLKTLRWVWKNSATGW